MVPMVDLFEIGQSKSSNDRDFKLTFKDNIGTVEAIQSFLPGETIIESLNWNNTDLLIFQGNMIRHNKHDCAFIDLSFQENKDDKLNEKRKQFFKTHFAFQGELYSYISECLSETNLFPKRLMFFFYTSVLDEKELSQEDPKTNHLELDKIVLEEGINQLKSILELGATNLEQDRKRLDESTTSLERSLITYKIDQKIILQRIINKYQQKIEEIGAEDIL